MPGPKGYHMKAVHLFFGKVMLATGLLLLMFFITDNAGADFPVWVMNYTFAAFGVSLTIYAFTFRRWREDDVE